MTRGALSGRTALVTGAGRGAGAAASRALSLSGASVILAARDAHALAVLVAKISAAGGHAVAVPTDLTNPVSVRRLVEQTLGAFGRLDAAFNAEVPSVSLAMRYEIPPMRRAGGGHIVNLAPTPATLELTRAAAVDLTGCGVRIDAVTGSAAEVAEAVVRLCCSDHA
jgi:hypothetical protein